MQKIAPVTLVRYLVHGPSVVGVVEFFSISSGVVGSVGGLNHLLVRKIMAYSSISHMG